MKYLADMENKKYIPVFEESGKLNWKINANLYKNLTNIINHKKANPPIQTEYRIVNTTHGTEGQPKIFTSFSLPERNNEYKLNYLCSIDNTTFIEKVVFTTDQTESWHGNYHRPSHPQKSERYKYILWMDEAEIMIHDTSIQVQHQHQDPQQQHAPEEAMTDEEMMEDEASETEDEDNNSLNDETFNLTEEDLAAFEQDFVFQYIPM